MSRIRDLEKTRAYGKVYYQVHKEERKAYRRVHRKREWQRRRELKLEVLGQYSIEGHPSCLYCGIDDMDVLCIDHINNNGAEERKVRGELGGAGLYYQLRRNGYPEGYQVLCVNCNLKKEIQRQKDRLGF